MLIGHDLEHSDIFLPLITTNLITFNQMQPVERDGRSMRSCRCEKQLGNEQDGVISDENRQGIFVFTCF